MDSILLAGILGLTLISGIPHYHALAGGSPGLDVKVHPNGSFSILAAGQTWLNSGPLFVHADGRRYSTDEGSLSIQGPAQQSTGQDGVGSYNMTTLLFGFKNTKPDLVKIQMNIKKYHDREMLIFSQHFLDSIEGTSTKDREIVMCGFPTVKTTSPSDLGILAYGGTFFWGANRLQRFRDSMEKLMDGMSSGPIVLFDQTSNVVVISPFSHFMTTSLTHDQQNGVLNWGMPGTVNAVPSGYSYEVSVYYSNRGINKAMSGWGNMLRKYYKKSTDFRHHDFTLNYLGYLTDDGAYYYNHTEKGMNYEDTILSVYKDAKEKGIPYRFLQLDDWWYPISKMDGDNYGSTIIWEPKPSVFPHGIQYIYNITRWPIVAHNRYWSALTPYAKQNGGSYDFYLQHKGNLSLPLEQRFWDDLFSEAVQWGLVVYEQDWLSFQEALDPLSADLHMGQMWLKQMGAAASRYGLRLQYCMAYPRHALQSLEIPSVTMIHVSGDYPLAPDQWYIGVSSMLADAVGLAPTKDVFWTVSQEPGNPYHGRIEPSPLLQATAAVLSTGPVCPGDRVGLANVTLIKRLVREDGKILKPSKTATTIDAQMVQEVFGGSLAGKGKVISTYTDIGSLRFGILLAANFSSGQWFDIGPSAAGWGQKFMDSMLYSYKATEGDVLKPFSDHNTLHLDDFCTLVDLCLYYTAPVIIWNSIPVSILGEMDKLVPVSPQRVVDIDISTLDVRITLDGMPGESVTFFLYVKSTWKCYQCVMNPAGGAVISLAHDTCY